jgi:hypothetical protein
MAATTYTGTGSNPRAIAISSTNSGNNPLGMTFQPDFVWVKARNTTFRNRLQNSPVGANKLLISDLTDAEYTNEPNGYLTSFNADGFTVTAGSSSDDGVNNLNDTYIAWQWNAGGAPTVDNSAGAGNVPTAGSVKINGSNSSATLAGSIAATRLSANQPAGFSVVTWTGNGALATIGHGLGVTPSMIITKIRSSTGGWPVYHASLGATGAVQLESSGAFSVTAAYWNNTAPTSTVFTVNSGINVNAATYVAYCFAPVAGYSAFGSYTGNGSTDGPFVYTGFRPRFVLFKSTSGPRNWAILDSSRNTSNVANFDIYPNLSIAEITQSTVDFLSNGFKLRVTDSDFNASGETYIYAAFAENPFKISRAR